MISSQHVYGRPGNVFDTRIFFSQNLPSTSSVSHLPSRYSTIHHERTAIVIDGTRCLRFEWICSAWKERANLSQSAPFGLVVLHESPDEEDAVEEVNGDVDAVMFGPREAT